METATGPGDECAHVTIFWPMKSCRQMSPGDRSENKKKSYFHCTVIIITSIPKTYEHVFTYAGRFTAHDLNVKQTSRSKACIRPNYLLKTRFSTSTILRRWTVRSSSTSVISERVICFTSSSVQFNIHSCMFTNVLPLSTLCFYISLFRGVANILRLSATARPLSILWRMTRVYGALLIVCQDGRVV